MNSRQRMNAKEFIEYIQKPVGVDKVRLFYKANNINNLRVELYSDFVFGLLHIVKDTYPGEDVMEDNTTIENHFNFCWENNIKNFEKEGLFCNKPTLLGVYSYTYSMVYDYFYSFDDKEKGAYNLFTTFNKLFNLEDGDKTRSELDIFIELYRLFNKVIISKIDDKINTNIEQ